MKSAWRAASALLWVAMAAGAAYIAITSANYVFDPATAFRLKPDAPGEVLGFRLHVLGGGAALLLGPLQFLSVIRRKAPAIHRWTGRAYVLFVAIGSVGAFILALHPMGGATTKFAFFTLATLWLSSTAMGFWTASRRQFGFHRSWMIRSYAMTFAAVTLRFGIPALIMGLGMTMSEAYQTVAWASWTINLIVAEWLIIPKAIRLSPPAQRSGNQDTHHSPESIADAPVSAP
jgi:uncharacterized membrane protein